MENCSICGKEFPEETMMMTEKGSVCNECYDDEPAPSTGISPLTILAIVAGVIPFFFNISSSTSTKIMMYGKVVYRSSNLNYLALIGGGLALAFAILSLIWAIRRKQIALLGLATMVAAGILGIVQLIRGFGFF